MMFDIVPLVERMVPGLVKSGRPSVACVCTTRPKYLVFDGDATRPACVVEFGDETRLRKTDRILSALSAAMPRGAVARSLCCAPWRDGLWVHVQEGLGGTPWFRLADEISTREAWEAFIARATGVMLQLHAAISRERAWTGSLLIGTELNRQASECLMNATPLDTRVYRFAAEWSEALDGVGPIPTCWQHGDFSLNNLLASPQSVAIIDFEEFGLTLAPLHDAFGLALSVTLSQEERCPLSLAECIKLTVEPCVAPAGVALDHLPALLMHHLLWRINQCHGVDRRARLRDILIRWAGELAESTDAFFPGLTTPIVGDRRTAALQ